LQVVFGESNAEAASLGQAPVPVVPNVHNGSFRLPRFRTGLSSGIPVVGLRQE